MIDVVPATPDMAATLRLQSSQVVSGQMMSAESIDMAVRGGMALAGVEAGKLIGMAGIFERWENCGLAWALLSETFTEHRFSVFKLMQRALDLSPLQRIEAYTADGHAAAERLLDRLGFEKEGVMRRYWQGQDFTLYARVR